MAFRADEAEANGYARALRYLVSPREVNDPEERQRSERKFNEIVDTYGPVVDSYPSWHPLVHTADPNSWSHGAPCEYNGYKGLDHTILFANAFVTCPYGGGDRVLESVESLADKSPSPHADVLAERLDVVFYNEIANPILVYCVWPDDTLFNGSYFPKRLAIGMMLEREIPCWKGTSLAETWDAMIPEFLGRPHGKRSSLFVDQETGQAMKTIWNAIINAGVYGPIKV